MLYGCSVVWSSISEKINSLLSGFFLSMLCGYSVVWSSTSEKINFLLLENHPWLLKLQREILWKDHCRCCVDAVNLQLGMWWCKDCESCGICSGVRVWQDAAGSAEDIAIGARMARWVMYDGDLIWVTVCSICVEEVLYGLQICFDKSQWSCYASRCCIIGKGVKWHGCCEVQMLDLWLFAMFCGFVSLIVTWFCQTKGVWCLCASIG